MQDTSPKDDELGFKPSRAAGLHLVSLIPRILLLLVSPLIYRSCTLQRRPGLDQRQLLPGLPKGDPHQTGSFLPVHRKPPQDFVYPKRLPELVLVMSPPPP